MFFHDIEGPQFSKTCVLPTAVNRHQRILRQSENDMKRAEALCCNVSASCRDFCIEDSLLSGDMTMAHA
jgi:hypothetical protein